MKIQEILGSGELEGYKYGGRYNAIDAEMCHMSVCNACEHKGLL